MQLIHLGESAGVVYWKPAGLRLYENLRSYIRRIHQDAGYQEVKTPSLVGAPVFERSGHLGKYRENMFLANQGNSLDSELDLSLYVLRPMSCPNHIEIYGSERRSYRELPMALFEFGDVFRNEASGSLQVLFRQRQFTQDDAHVFVRPSQVGAGLLNFLKMALKAYADLGFKDVNVAISLRPAQRFGSEEDWDRAEEGCRQACREAGVAWTEEPGGGAFYGPKIELGVKDRLGRSWQLGTIQLDYVMPQRFELSYVAEDGSREVPVMLHHAVLGSLERMIGTLLEAHGNALPAALHPYPLVIVPVSEGHKEYAQVVYEDLLRRGRDVQLDRSDDPLGAKVRAWRTKGALKLVVIGDRERSAQTATEFAAAL